MKGARAHHRSTNRIARHRGLVPREGMGFDVWERPFGFGLLRPFFREPGVDISETGNKVIVKADIPGMQEKDIKVSLHKDMLTIAAERSAKREIRKKDSYYLERTEGSIQRSVRLPEGVKKEGRTTHYRNGVLSVEFHKR